jgi:transposase-like protein
MELNLSGLAKHFTDEASAWELVEKMQWPNGPVCPHCGETGRAYLLANKAGSYRRTWKCADCRRKFSVLVGSVFEGTKVPLSKWLMAIYLLAASKNGVAAFELHRTLGVTHKTAWFMVHRIREGMKVAPFAAMMRGTVVADETHVGGAPGNRHGYKPGRGGQGVTDKTPVLSMISKDTGEVRSQAVADVTGATLRKAMAHYADIPNTVLHTDGARSYLSIRAEFAAHESVDHFSGEYVRGDVTTNQAENYFSQLKRSLDGTHHHVSREHLPRYLAEHDFRYSTRKISDSERMVRLMGQTSGRRLTYKRLIAKS